MKAQRVYSYTGNSSREGTKQVLILLNVYEAERIAQELHDIFPSLFVNKVPALKVLSAELERELLK